MEPEKMMLAGLVAVLAVVGLAVAVVTVGLGGSPPTNAGGSGSGDPSMITDDVDLIDLSLRLPNWPILLSNETLIETNDLRGKFLLVDLMATWCSACKMQNTYLLDAYGSFSGDVRFLSLSVDVSDTPAMMEDYKNENGLPWTHGLDTNSAFSDYFSVSAVPTMVIIDDRGYVRWRHQGLWDADAIADALLQLM